MRLLIDSSVEGQYVTMVCEMKTTPFRIWTRVVKFAYYDDNHYTTSIFKAQNIFYLIVEHSPYIL